MAAGTRAGDADSTKNKNRERKEKYEGIWRGGRNMSCDVTCDV